MASDDNLLAALGGFFGGVGETIKPFAEARYKTDLEAELARKASKEKYALESKLEQEKFMRESAFAKSQQESKIELERLAKESEITSAFGKSFSTYEELPGTPELKNKLGLEPGKKYNTAAVTTLMSNLSKEDIASKKPNKADVGIDKELNQIDSVLNVYNNYINKVKEFRGSSPISTAQALKLKGQSYMAEKTGGLVSPEISALNKVKQANAGLIEKITLGMSPRTLGLLKFEANEIPNADAPQVEFDSLERLFRDKWEGRKNQLLQLKQSGKSLTEEGSNTTSSPLEVSPTTQIQPGRGLNQNHIEELKGFGIR